MIVLYDVYSSSAPFPYIQDIMDETADLAEQNSAIQQALGRSGHHGYSEEQLEAGENSWNVNNM